MPDTDINPLVAEADASMADMERETAALFAAKDAARIGTPPPADDAAPAPVAKPATDAPAAPVAKGKIAGAPAAPAAPKADVAPAKDATPAPDPFADVPREYPTGKVTSKNWTRLHEKIDFYESQATAARKEAEELRAKLAGGDGSTPASPEIAARLATIQQERDALQARLEAVAVERSPRFEAAFKPRQEAAIAQARAAVGPAQADRVAALLAMPESSYRDEQIDTLVSELGGGMRSAKLTQAVADLDRLAAERSNLAAKGADLWKTWTAEESAARDRQQAERTATANATFDSELASWRTSNLVNDADIATARSVYSGQVELKDAANAAMWAVVGPKLAQAASADRARVAELESELAKLRRVQPNAAADSGGPAPAVSDDDESDASLSFMDRVAKQAVAQGFLRR